MHTLTLPSTNEKERLILVHIFVLERNSLINSDTSEGVVIVEYAIWSGLYRIYDIYLYNIYNLLVYNKYIRA